MGLPSFHTHEYSIKTENFNQSFRFKRVPISAMELPQSCGVPFRGDSRQMPRGMAASALSSELRAAWLVVYSTDNCLTRTFPNILSSYITE